jgi:hypothetical protein
LSDVGPSTTTPLISQHTYHHLPTMSLNGYIYSTTPGKTITRRDQRDYGRSRLHRTQPYPSTRELVERASGSARTRDGLPEFHNTDALWGYAISASYDLQEREGRAGRSSIIQRLLDMGLFEWGSPDCRGLGEEPPVSMRYAAVMGNAILRRVEALEDEVGDGWCWRNYPNTSFTIEHHLEDAACWPQTISRSFQGQAQRDGYGLGTARLGLGWGHRCPEQSSQ